MWSESKLDWAIYHHQRGFKCEAKANATGSSITIKGGSDVKRKQIKLVQPLQAFSATFWASHLNILHQSAKGQDF